MKRWQPPLVVGLDIGTTAARAAVFDAGGRLLAVAGHSYPLHTPHPGWAEQDPLVVSQAASAAVASAVGAASRRAGITSGDVAALSLSSILHSLILVDTRGAPVSPSLIWADTRSVAEAEEISEACDALAMYHRTGCPVHPMYSPAKLRWLRRHRPDEFARSARVLSIKDFLVHRLLGEYVTDVSVASGTGLFGLARRDWDQEALALAGITVSALPRVVEPTDVIGRLDTDAARALGLAPGTPVVAGAGDGVLSNLGSGCAAPGQMTAMIATSGAVRVMVDRPLTDPAGTRTWCYYLAQDRWVAGAAINNGGLVLRWMRDVLWAARTGIPVPMGGAAGDVRRKTAGARPQANRLAHGGGHRSSPAPSGDVPASDYQLLEHWAADVAPGADGLLFLPFLAGERSPFWNAGARGVVFGLSLAHSHRHVVRAALEGVAYRMRSILAAVEDVAGTAVEIRATGGFVRSKLWVQILADVLGRELVVPDTPEASALGAAMLGHVALGTLATLDEAAGLVRVKRTCRPDVATRETYDRLYDLYFRVYWRLQEEFRLVTALQNASA